MVIATFRGNYHSRRNETVIGYASDGMNCSSNLTEWIGEHVGRLKTLRAIEELNGTKTGITRNDESYCLLQSQADFFYGPYGITHPVDARFFPVSANILLQERGYDFQIESNNP